MFRIKKFIFVFILVLFAVFPSVIYGKANILDLSLAKNNDDKTEITIAASDKYKYLVHAIKNDLIIVFDEATFDSRILNKFNNYRPDNNNISSINLEQKTDGSARIVIHTKNIKDFKFYINAKNGIAAPYGFDKQVVRANKRKHTTRIPVTARAEVKKNDNIDKNTSAKLISDSDSTLYLPEEISNHSENKSKRLDMSNVVVPDDYFAKPEPLKVKEPQPIKQSQKQEIQKVETKKNLEKDIKKPIPVSELLKTLNSNNLENINIPRMIKESEKELKVSTETIESDYSQEEDSSNPEKPLKNDDTTNIITSIKEIPNGSANKPLILKPDGSNTISVNQLAEDFIENYEVKSDVKTHIPLNPRELSFMPLGLSEEFNFEEPQIVDNFGIPKPKSTMTSDGGMLAFTVISPEGSYEKRSQIKQINSMQNNNYSYSVSSDSRVIDVGKQFSEEDKLKFKRLIIEAKDYYDSGSSSAAEIKYKQAISINPQKPWGYIALAGLYETEGRYEDAIQAYMKAIKFLPDKIELLYNISLNYYKDKQFNKSEKYLSKVISLSPNFVLAYYNLGTLYYKMKEYDRAIDYLNKAINLNPVLTDAYYNLGVTYLYKNNKEEALRYFKHCYDIDPYDKQCYQMLEKIK